MATTLPSGDGFALEVTTRYPWEGSVGLEVREAPGGPASLKLRIPGWCQGASVRVNGRTPAEEAKPGSYLDLGRTWKAGDAIESTARALPYVDGYPG